MVQRTPWLLLTGWINLHKIIFFSFFSARYFSTHLWWLIEGWKCEGCHTMSTIKLLPTFGKGTMPLSSSGSCWRFKACPESIRPFWISREPVAWPWCNLAASQRRPYCASVNSHTPVGLVSRTGRVALMYLSSQSEETLLSIREQLHSRGASLENRSRGLDVT